MVEPEVVTVTFWAGESQPPPEVEAHPDHPCGATITLSVPAVPLGLDWLEHEWAYQIDEAGRVVRSWPVPIDTHPLGISGEQLILSPSSMADEAIWVSPDGRLSESQQPDLPPLFVVPCPEAFDEFGESAYPQCLRREGVAGSLIAFLGPCT